MQSKEILKVSEILSTMLRLRSCSRIHITLIDMNASLGRVDGGVGLTLEEPYIEILANSDIADEGPEETLESSIIIPMEIAISPAIKEIMKAISLNLFFAF